MLVRSNTTQRLINAQIHFADQDDIAKVDNGISLHLELENEFKNFYENACGNQRIRRHEQQVVANHESYVTNYFIHFHHTHVPIVPGEKEKYWEEYHFGFKEDISDEWRVAGEAKRKRKTDKGNKKSAKKAK